VNDDFEDPTIKAILDSAVTGDVGDGKIFVSDIQECYRIRTGEKGGNTLK
jgi:nitrogen regulatory protein P-II 1